MVHASAIRQRPLARPIFSCLFVPVTGISSQSPSPMAQRKNADKDRARAVGGGLAAILRDDVRLCCDVGAANALHGAAVQGLPVLFQVELRPLVTAGP